METNWSSALKDSISEVFSTSFFLVPESYPDPPEMAHQMSADGWFEGYLDFTRSGEVVRIWVWAPENIAVELAANIFACDPEEVDTEQVLDAYREMINMVSGNLLTVVDAESAWKMGLPNASMLGTGTVGEARKAATQDMIFDVEGSPIIAGWNVFAK